MIHRKVLAAFEEIDAAVYNSDTFDAPTNAAVLRKYVECWLRWLEEPALPEPSKAEGSE